MSMKLINGPGIYINVCLISENQYKVPWPAQQERPYSFQVVHSLGNELFY